MEKLAEVKGIFGNTLQLVKEGNQLFLVDGERRYVVHTPVEKVLSMMNDNCTTYNPQFSMRFTGSTERMKNIDVVPQAPFYDLKALLNKEE